MATATKPVTYSGPEAAELAGISYRQVDYWCRQGVLGAAHQRPIGSGQRRQLTGWDVLALRAVGRVSAALIELFGRDVHAGSVTLYRDVADQVRAGRLHVAFEMGEHVELTLYVADLVDGLELTAPTAAASSVLSPAAATGDVDRRAAGATPGRAS